MCARVDATQLADVRQDRANILLRVTVANWHLMNARVQTQVDQDRLGCLDHFPKIRLKSKLSEIY